ncbi:MAG: hypothetical protein R3Y53_11325 [Bacillota bacterium]
MHELQITPSELMSLSIEDRAFMIAAIDIKLEREKKEASKMKSKR